MRHWPGGIGRRNKFMHESHGILQHLIGPHLSWLFGESVYWTVFGILGNCVFGSRFLVQWLYSEKLGRLVVPPVFWHLSFWGSIISLVYGLHIDKLPVILGYLFLPIINGRNLVLLRRTRREAAKGAEKEAGRGGLN